MRDAAARLSVLQLVHSLRIGGSEKVAFDIASHLDAQRFEPSVCGLDVDGELSQELDRLNIRHHVFFRRGVEAGVSRRIFQYIRRYRIDVLHTHHFAQLFYGALPARLAGARVIHTEHEFFTYHQSAVARRLIGPLLRLCSRMTVVGPEVAEYFQGTIGIPARTIQVVSNGVDVSRFGEDRLAARTALGLNAGDLVLGTIGRLEVEKDQRALLEAFQRLAAHRPDARLVIAGDGQLAGALKEQASQLGILDRTLFLGYRRDIARLLAAFDIFVLPSIREGLPVSLIEAMAASRPVVASDVGSVKDLITDDHCGFVVPPRDPAALDAALGRLAADASLRERLGAAGRRTAESRYSLAAIVKQYEALYSAAAGR